MFFDGWDKILRILVMGVLGYAALIAILRISGKRTLSKMNAFDLIVTVALGSTLATLVLSKDVTLSEGVVALGLLVGLQFIVSWLSVRSSAVRRLVRSEPSLLVWQGEFLRDAMRHQRVTESEVRQAARSQGISDLAGHTVILETDGKFSVIESASAPATRSTLKDVPRAD